MYTYTTKDKRFIITTYKPLTAEEQVVLMDLMDEKPDEMIKLMQRMGFEAIDLTGKYKPINGG